MFINTLTRNSSPQRENLLKILLTLMKAIQDVTKFVSSLKHIWRNLASNIICSPMDALQWMGAVRMRVQTSYKNITIIYTTTIHQLMTCEVKSYMFVALMIKSIIKVLSLNHCFQLKYESSIHNIAFSSEKVVSSKSGEKYAHQALFTSENSLKQY